LIFRRWHQLNGLSAMQAEYLVMLSYVDVFLFKHLALFRKGSGDHFAKSMVKLQHWGYVIRIKVPGKRYKERNGYVLTQRGKDFEADYEKFYDERMAELKQRKTSYFRFDDGSYFRKIYINRSERREAQGGGKLSFPKMAARWKDAVPITEDKDYVPRKK
jgi:hypothetical protein